ncbi:double-stranded RNA-binding protein 4-like [Magnolia sinica]|uniref:double-stranded RNA-binding protein 4-like n=1 Tax=Magnolia sinica TaxID=86752 RepID=UPI0026590DCE|nr:double-stranded RNA-binding protein 4-like [Magnolia sinica]
MVEAVKMPQPLPAPQPLSAPSKPRVPEHFLYKNRLQEYSQSLGITLPVYHTINEGSQHAPRFRSTVMIDGATYRSAYTFNHRKAAEQDVAKLALEHVSKRVVERVLVDDGCPLIREDPVFCKSILYEYTVKMKLEKPTYNTSQTEGGLLPVFVSSLTFDGKSYTGAAGRNKKEAEQMAARAVILSILGNSGSKALLSQIIKSKMKLYAALHKVNGSSPAHNTNLVIGGQPEIRSEDPLSKGKDIETASATGSLVPVQAPLELKKPKQEAVCEGSSVPIGNPIPVLNESLAVRPAESIRACGTISNDTHLVHHNQPGSVIPSDAEVPFDAQEIAVTGPARKRRKRNKKGKQVKKVRNDDQEVINCTPLQAHPASFP